MSLIFRLPLLALPFLWLSSCSSPGGAGGDRAQVASLEQQHTALAAERSKLATLAGELEQARRTGRDATALERQLASRRSALRKQTEQIDQLLVDYLNAHRPTPDQPGSEDQQKVLAIKIREDLAAAEEFIREGGDYPHALEIYHDLLLLAPGNSEVMAAQTAAEANRTMTRERFAALRKGMSQDQVRDALGMPHLKNIQTFEEQGIVAWFYPTSEAGTAGVYFQAEGAGDPAVYRWDFAVNRGRP